MDALDDKVLVWNYHRLYTFGGVGIHTLKALRGSLNDQFDFAPIHVNVNGYEPLMYTCGYSFKSPFAYLEIMETPVIPPELGVFTTGLDIGRLSSFFSHFKKRGFSPINPSDEFVKEGNGLFERMKEIYKKLEKEFPSLENEFGKIFQAGLYAHFLSFHKKFKAKKVDRLVKKVFGI